MSTTTQSRKTPSAVVTSARRTTCRYLKRTGDQCTAEVVDEAGEILLCLAHLGRAMELIEQRKRALRGGR